MSNFSDMLNNLNNWFNKIDELFKESAGLKDQALFIDNNQGDFSFLPQLSVLNINVASTTSGLTASRAAIIANNPEFGTTLANVQDQSVETYDPDTATWTVSKIDYGKIVLHSRYYYSPWNKTIWLTTPYGALRRFITTGLTQIG